MRRARAATGTARFASVSPFPGVWACALIVCSTLVAAEPVSKPAPELTPRQVVEAQLAALQRNGDDDSGVRVAFLFASPRNQETTGPVERFIRMLHAPAYAPLLDHRTRSLSETTQVDDMARIKVTLVDAEGEQAAYVWILSRQSEPPCQGCWMTDTVLRVEVRNSPFQTAADWREYR